MKIYNKIILFLLANTPPLWDGDEASPERSGGRNINPAVLRGFCEAKHAILVKLRKVLHFVKYPAALRRGFLFFVLMFIAFVAKPVFAAEIFFGVHNKDIGVNAKFETGVFIDTQNELINAIEGQIIFPSDSFEFQGFYSGNSILTFWVQQPVLISQGVVSFSGIVPGGFTGNKGYLFSLILKTKQKGDFTISTVNEKILLNDGIASGAKVTKAPLNLNIVEKVSSQTFTPLYDSTPPESFEPQISKDPNIFNGEYFLAFATQDKGSGIDHYEAMETGQFGSFTSLFSKNNWVVAESPYPLKDQTLKNVILVKAVDKTGNEIIVKVKPKNALAWYENYFVLGIMVLICLIFIGYKLWEKH